MKRDDDSAGTSTERLQAQLRELARANEILTQQLAEKTQAVELLEANTHRLRSLAEISADWYWEQDAQYRFVDFASEANAIGMSIAGPVEAIGKCRWELSGVVPLTAPWGAHRAVLEAHESFRNFEYMRVLADGVPYFFSVSGVPVFDNENQFIGYRGTTRDISRSKRSEELERQASRFLDEIVENIPIAFHLKSAKDYRMVAWNRAAQELYGLTREETLGKTVHELWPKAEADSMHAADLALIAAGEMQDFPDRLAQTKQRGAIHVHMRKVPLKDANGVVTHILVTTEEITERLAAQARLRHSEIRFRSLTSLSSDWYWETDAQFRFTKLSGGMSDQVRLAIGEHIGKTRWEIDHSGKNTEVWAQHRAQLERHETFRNFEYVREEKDGKRLALSISGEPIVDASGKFTGYRGVGTDITARKETEAALRLSESRFRTVVGALAEGVVLRDADGYIVDCNASAERILGRSLAQMKGQKAMASEWQMLREDGSFMPEEERPSVVALRTGLPQSNRVVCYQKPDGSFLWTLVNVQPLFDGADPTPTGFVSSLTDISQRKRAEMEIVRLNVDLENRVSRRTAQLEMANRELEAFSYSVAHDLRSPLSTIDGYCALLEKTVPAESLERARTYLVRIRGGVRRMGELTDGLLSLAQLSRTSLNWDAVDLSAEASKVLRQWSENDPARVVAVSVEPGMVVRADPSLLRQVLENLIANAWKFTSKKPQAKISVGREIGTDQQVTYFVRDTGAGFDMTYADKLFGTFQRLHSPEEFAGSGIGLATVNRIITRHGGRIWARSTLGEGSTFYFTLGAEQKVGVIDSDTRSDDEGIAMAQMPRASQLVGAAPATHAGRTAISSDNDAFTVTDQQFTNAFEHAAIGMALIALDSRRLRVNSAFCQMLGYSEAEMLSRTVREITHPDDIEWDISQRKRALAGEIETYQWEKRYIHKAGHTVWGFLTCSLVRDADRKPLHFISQVQDITERKEAEKTLRESEERFRALTALSSDWFWEQDENFRFVQISGGAGQAELALGTRDNSIGKTRWEIDNVNMDEKVWAEHKALLDRHEPFRDFEVPRLDANGQIRYRSLSGVPIFDASGRFTGYRGTGRDTTELHRVTDALRASEAQLRQITDTVPALIAYVDKDTRFGFHNRAYEEAFGLSHGQIEGKTMREVMGDEFYERVRLRVEEVLTGYPVVYERTQKTPRGDQRDYVVNYFPRYGDGDEDGQVIGFYSLATDITELKRIDRMKSEFVSTVSHELRTPLTSIRGSLGLISGGVAGQLPEAVKTLVGIAKTIASA